jgi:DNA adenine methylase
MNLAGDRTTRRNNGCTCNINANASDVTTSQPIIRWAGSKRKLLSHLCEADPRQFGTYYEPFFGSGCLFFALKPNIAVLGDINPALISFYSEVRLKAAEVWSSAIRYRRDSDSYYALRRRFLAEVQPTRRAAMFLYLNRFCFNAIFRTNRKNEFNVPFGTRSGSFPRRKDFAAAGFLLRSATLMCRSYPKTSCLSNRCVMGENVGVE